MPLPKWIYNLNDYSPYAGDNSSFRLELTWKEEEEEEEEEVEEEDEEEEG
jgi:hypothetical protein